MNIGNNTEDTASELSENREDANLPFFLSPILKAFKTNHESDLPLSIKIIKEIPYCSHLNTNEVRNLILLKSDTDYNLLKIKLAIQIMYDGGIIMSSKNKK